MIATTLQPRNTIRAGLLGRRESYFMKRFVSRISAVLLPARLSAKALRMPRMTPPRTPMRGVSAADVQVRIRHQLDRIFGVSAGTTPRPAWLT
jgi:hypothetical protein